MKIPCTSCGCAEATRFFQVIVEEFGLFAWCESCCADPDLFLDQQLETKISEEIKQEEYVVADVMVA